MSKGRCETRCRFQTLVRETDSAEARGVSMQSAQERAYPHIPGHLVNVLDKACQGDILVYDLFNDFFAHGTYKRTWACKLIDVANGTLSTVWQTRSIATLMLEHSILKL